MNGTLTKNKGFTLIEVITAVAIFGLLISVLAGFFVSSIRSQQKTLYEQQLIDNTSYALEYISRALRMAKKDTEGNCITQNYNYETNSSKNRIRFLNYEDKCQEFYFEEGRVKERKSFDGNALNFGSGVPITSNEYEVLSFKLAMDSSWGQGQKTQPRIVFVFEIKKEEGGIINIQTTVSQRDLNKVY